MACSSQYVLCFHGMSRTNLMEIHWNSNAKRSGLESTTCTLSSVHETMKLESLVKPSHCFLHREKGQAEKGIILWGLQPWTPCFLFLSAMYSPKRTQDPKTFWQALSPLYLDDAFHLCFWLAKHHSNSFLMWVECFFVNLDEQSFYKTRHNEKLCRLNSRTFSCFPHFQIRTMSQDEYRVCTIF